MTQLLYELQPGNIFREGSRVEIILLMVEKVQKIENKAKNAYNKYDSKKIHF